MEIRKRGRGWGNFKPKIFKGLYEPTLEFPEGRRGSSPKTLHEKGGQAGYGYFLEHYIPQDMFLKDHS